MGRVRVCVVTGQGVVERKFEEFSSRTLTVRVTVRVISRVTGKVVGKVRVAVTGASQRASILRPAICSVT